MTRILLTLAAVGIASMAQAGPLGLFPLRGSCGGQRVGLVNKLRQCKPVAKVGQTVVSVPGKVVELRPVAVFVGGCVNGVCRPK